MPSLDIRRAQGTIARRDQIIDVVVSRKQLSDSHYSAIRFKNPRLYDLWRGVFTGRFTPHKNNVHIPLIFSVIWSDVARKASTSFGVWPIVNFLGYGPDDAPIARKREALISAQMKDANAFRKACQTFLTADLYGNAITQVMWDKREQEMMVPDFQALPLSGELIKTVKKQTVCLFDGPNYEDVDRLDFSPQPGVKHIDDMAWVIRKYFLDLDDVRALAAQGMFDKAELARLEQEGANGNEVGDEATMRRHQAFAVDDETSKKLDRYSRPVELWEMWGTVPSELSDDGILHRVITVANRRYLMRNRPNPFWHQRKPFINFSPTPDPHYFDSPGKAEVAEKLQIVANRFTNQTLDATDLFIDPVFFYDRQAGLQTRNLYMRPGRFIGMDGIPGDKVMPLVPNLSGVQLGTQKTQEMWQYMQQGTGIVEDTIQGGGGADRQTAREFVGRRESVATRLLLESRIFEETYLEPLANMMVALDKQFLETPAEVLILGDSAIIDPVTGAPIQGSRETLDGFDLVPDYAARAYGATTALSRGVRQQNLVQLMTAVSANPAAMGSINFVNFFRMMFREFEIPNVNELIQATPPLAQVMAQAGLGPGAAEGGAGQQGAAPPGQEGTSNPQSPLAGVQLPPLPSKQPA